MKIHLNQLVIETTRRCNMNCDHCLRGDAQNLDMNLEYIENLFNVINSINTITFSGGEPTLVVDILEKILKLLKRKKIEVGNFYMATNGYGLNDNNFANFLLKMYQYCGDNEITQVEISRDDFHVNNDIEIKDTICNTFKFVTEKEYVEEKYMIHEGHARYYDFGREHNFQMEFEYDISKLYKTIEFTDTCYLNCKGILLPECDFSYDSQDLLDGTGLEHFNFSKKISKKDFIKLITKENL